MPKMKAIAKLRASPGADIIEIDIPQIGTKDVLIKVKTASICGTDYHIYSWDQWAQKRINIPRIFGHEVAGEVVEVGKDVTAVKVGDFISAETHIACGHCFQCRNGMAHICQNVRILGVDVDGVFAEYAAVPENNAWVLEENIPKDFASVMEPLGNAIHTVLAGDIAGTNVVILGCGPIGLMSVAVCRIAGATRIIASEVNEVRIDLAKKMGADVVINPLQDDLLKEVMILTNGLGVDVVIEMSGNPDAIRDGFKVLRSGGRYSILSIPKEPLTLDIATDIVFKQATVQGINGRIMFNTWYKTSRFLSSGRLDLAPIITHRFRLEELEKGMELMKTGNCGKVLLYPA